MSEERKYQYHQLIEFDPNKIPSDWFALNKWMVEVVACIMDSGHAPPDGVVNVYAGVATNELYHRVRQVDLMQLHDTLKALQTPVCTWNEDQIEMTRDAIRKMASGIEEIRNFLVEATGLEYALKDRERERNGKS